MVIKNWIGSLRRQSRLSKAESGQSLIILALAFLGLIAMLGLALDLGILYIERIHLKRAVDASALAGVVELPNEEAAMTRAIDYLRANDYAIPNPDGTCSSTTGPCDVAVKVMGCARSTPGEDFDTLANWPTPHNYITVANPRATFILDTYSFQTTTRDCDPPSGHGSGATAAVAGSANKLIISGTVTVGMNFMQFFGYSTAPASDSAAAQNITNLDIAVIFDNSGSMEGDTICYDCWHENTNNVTTYPYPKNGAYQPISYTTMINNNLCVAASTPYAPGGSSSNRYVIMEGELYSRNVNASWSRRQAGQGYWAIQRGNTDTPRASSIEGAFATSGDRSAYVAHHPYWTYGQPSPPAPLLGRFYTLQDAQSDAAPRLDYDFTASWNGDAYIWIRAQGGGLQSFWVNQVGNSYQHDANKLYWAVDSNVPVQNSSALTCDHVYAYAGCYSPTISHDDFDCVNPVACKNRWSWFRLGSIPVTANSLHTLKLWAGSPGYAIDKIVVTNNSAANASGLNDVLTANGERGRPATQGSARGGATAAKAGACDPCNPIFGLTVNPSDCTTPYYLVDEQTNNLGNPLFGDREPLRSSIEATKRFVMKLNPQYDQASFVGFDSSVNEQSELTCLRRQTALGNPTACYVGTSAISFTNVLQRIENQTASGGTNIATALRNGLETLGYNVDSRSGVDNLCDGSANSACGRGGAKRVIVLLTDGSPNDHSGDACHSDPNLWPYNSDPDFDCVMYYAKKAHQSNTVIYTIGLGNGVIPELLKAVADETNGTYYWASSPSKLDAIFDQILSNIYVRLIQ